MRAVDPPEALRAHYRDWSWTPAWSYRDAVTAWRLRSAAGDVRFLKVRAAGEEPSLADEESRLRWAAARLPVPTVLASGTEGDVDWLVTAGLPGRDAIAPELRAHPARLVPELARGLRRLHDTPVDGCPFRLTVDDAIAAARRRVTAGTVQVAELHEEHRHLSPNQALAWMEELAPDEEDPVLCHGDYCFPNVMVEGWRVTAYLDLGELNVADRWWDLAVATWSTTWNAGPGWEHTFLEAYAAEPDERRMTFWRLVYDLIS
ncbi:MAG: APH(3') family aminoglycoside O-phosphotransferase [Acidimicrobiia bacterium]